VATDIGEVDDVALHAAGSQIYLTMVGRPVAAFLPDGRC
jgi:hypothetical protein